MPQEIQTITQTITTSTQRKTADKELNALLASGWNVLELATQPARVNSDGLRIMSRIVTLIRDIPTEEDEPLIFCGIGETVVNGKIVRYEPSAPTWEDELDDAITHLVNRMEDDKSAYDPNTWGISQSELR